MFPLIGQSWMIDILKYYLLKIGNTSLFNCYFFKWLHFGSFMVSFVEILPYVICSWALCCEMKNDSHMTACQGQTKFKTRAQTGIYGYHQPWYLWSGSDETKLAPVDDSSVSISLKYDDRTVCEYVVLHFKAPKAVVQ